MCRRGRQYVACAAVYPYSIAIPSSRSCRFTTSYEKKPKEEGGRPNTRTKKIDCPCRVNLRRSRRDRTAVGPWRVSSLELNHNHVLADDARSLKAGPLSAEQKRQIQEQSQMGVPPSLLREAMQRHCAYTITEDQITSAISEAKRLYENGRSDAEVLRAQLERPGTFYRVCTMNLRSPALSLPYNPHWAFFCAMAPMKLSPRSLFFFCPHSPSTQVLTARLPDGRQELRAVFWRHDFQAAAFQRNPTVINLDNTGMWVRKCICASYSEKGWSVALWGVAHRALQ